MALSSLLLPAVLGLGSIVAGVYVIYAAVTPEGRETANAPMVLVVLGLGDSQRAHQLYAGVFGSLLCFIGAVTVGVGVGRLPFGRAIGAWSLLLGWFSLDVLVAALFSTDPERDLPARRGEKTLSAMPGGTLFRRTVYAIMGLSGLLLTAVGILGFTTGTG